MPSHFISFFFLRNNKKKYFNGKCNHCLLQQALQVQQRNKNTSGGFKAVFQHWLNQHVNTPILILISIFNFLWKLFTFCKLFGSNIEVKFQLSLSLLRTTSIFASLYALTTNFEFSTFSVKFRKKEIYRKSLQNTCIPVGSQCIEFVILWTQELIWGGKHLRGCGNWLWDFLMLFKIEELMITAANSGIGNASQIIE